MFKKNNNNKKGEKRQSEIFEMVLLSVCSYLINKHIQVVYIYVKSLKVKFENGWQFPWKPLENVYYCHIVMFTWVLPILWKELHFLYLIPI